MQPAYAAYFGELSGRRLIKKLPETSQLNVLCRECRTRSRPLFFTAAYFHLALVAASISHFVTAATKFSCCSSNKKMSPLFFISRSKSLSPFFSLSFAGLPPTFSFSLSFSCSIFQICGYDNLSKLDINQTTRIQKQFPPSVFVFIDSLAASGLQDAGCYAISRQNSVELHLGCHMPLVRTDGRSVGVRSRDYQILWDGQVTSFSYPWCSVGALRAQELRYKLLDKDKCDMQQLFTEVGVVVTFSCWQIKL